MPHPYPSNAAYTRRGHARLHMCRSWQVRAHQEGHDKFERLHSCERIDAALARAEGSGGWGGKWSSSSGGECVRAQSAALVRFR
ncbi:hypothetical protein FOMPIDRAFT_1023712 [Fomitopsis schrenkii]|uniref:Uncharacterized protein n=1 Tax=Fomitopsis schrenkii TaxID=2126942 RepID=S8E697_FOMSC|nr:hypothetical protein FOMPIDRAFT_1023712 [Fomitopsis schrenkii]